MTKNDKSKAKSNEKVAEKLKDMGLMPSEDGVKPEESTEGSSQESIQDNKIPYALIVTFVLFISGIMGIMLMAGNDDESGAESTAQAPVNTHKNMQISRQDEMNKLFAERRKAMQERNKAMQERNQSMMSSQPEIRSNTQQPAWVNEQRKLMQQQMNQRPIAQDREFSNSSSEMPAWMKERQAMMAKRHEQQLKQQEQYLQQQKEQQQKQMMAYQQWLKTQQRNQPVYANPQPVVRAPASYYPNGYNPYPPVPYYAPRY